MHMDQGVLLDSKTGRPEPDMRELQRNVDQGWHIRGFGGEAPDMSRLPQGVQDLLAKSSAEPAIMLPRGAMQLWRETLFANLADGAAVTAAAETIMIPDFTFPANYMYPGRVLKYTLLFKYSTAITTPGTITMRLRWGGVAGTILAASGAFAPDPTAAGTDITGMVEWWVIARSVGTAAPALCFGKMTMGDMDDASATTLKNNLDMKVIPQSAPATVNIDTTTAKALSPTWQQSVATGSMTVMLAILESLS